MYVKHTINHMIPGRIRLTIPALADIQDYQFIKELFESVRGITKLRVIPLIQSMVIEYDAKLLNQNQIMQCVDLFFYQPKKNTQFSQNKIKRDMRNNILRSGGSGLLLLIALLRKNINAIPDAFDYLVLLSTSYTALSHGEDNLNHPDVITGMLSILSLGPNNILKAAALTWVVNLIEIINDIRRNSYLLYTV